MITLAAVESGAVERLRPKMMTVAAITLSLVPILWSQQTGSDVLKRIAAPMVGGLITSAALTLIVLPAIYSLFRERHLKGSAADDRAYFTRGKDVGTTPAPSLDQI